MLAQAGGLTLARDATTGMLAGTTLGSLKTALTHDGYGDLESLGARHGTTALFGERVERDAIGRIVAKVETTAAGEHRYEYGYDPADRLKSVKRDDELVVGYRYDDNGNRIAETPAGEGEMASSYDDQDRLLARGETVYAWTKNGELRTKTTGEDRTAYDYDALGALKRVELPDGRVVSYVVDGFGRRVAKQLDGKTEYGLLYGEAARPSAQLDADGSIRSRFVYATRSTVPDYMVRGASTYRIVTDHLGSPRLVVDAATGEIAQQLDYDTFGRVVRDTNPGFQPFGFAGGLYDPDTGLVRFGARDYDPETGRWTAQDPIDFSGGDTNLYGYVANDPVNFTDPSGLAVDAIADGVTTGASLAKLALGCGSWTDVGLNVLSLAIPGVTGLAALNRARKAAKARTGAREARVTYTAEGERFVRVGAKPENLNMTFEHPGGTRAGTYAFPEDAFEAIGPSPARLKDLGDLPGDAPLYYRLLQPPPGTPIQRGTVPGGQFGGRGGVSEVYFPEGF